MQRKAFAPARGFTLIEVLIVIVIVLALGGLVAYNLLGTKEKAEADIVKIQMNSIKGALKNFRFTYGRFPTDEEGIKALWDKSAMTDEADAAKWTKFLDDAIPTDRFGNEWGYRQVSEHGDESTFDLWSYGPDRQEGTDDDVVSWNKDAQAAPESGGT